MSEAHNMNNDDDLAEAVKNFEAQIDSAPNGQDSIARARALAESEIVAITRKLCDIALYSDNASHSLRASMFLFDQVANQKNLSVLTDAEQEMFAKMGLDK